MGYLPALQDKLIVLVEDHDDLRNLLSQFLTRQGARVLASPNAADAFSLIQRYRPSVVLLDIGLPDRNGFELLQEIRALSPRKGGNVSVIAMTAFGGIVDRSRTVAAGFQGHLAKPFRPHELLEALKSLLI
ncbi:MAG TPA: response regulator [Chthoniobacterales bacterium]|jgi:DNA-binding response OmpR family regulator|nr:response regulator [Chthoniobacterales bacterium]